MKLRSGKTFGRFGDDDHVDWGVSVLPNEECSMSLSVDSSEISHSGCGDEQGQLKSKVEVGTSKACPFDDHHAGKSTADAQPFSRRRVILCVQLNIFLYALCFWVQQTSFPYMTKKLGVDNVTYGYLQTVFALVQLLGGPLFGRFGDLFGARAALTLAYASGVATYGVLALASNVEMLFISRAVSVFLASMQGSQMVITDLTPYNDRADAMGKLGLYYGVGMVIGPFLGGFITKAFGEEAAAMTAAVGSVFSLVMVCFYVPRHVKHVSSSEQSISNVFNMKQIARLFAFPNTTYLMIIKIAVGFPIGILQSVFSVIAMNHFRLPAHYNGMIMSYVGIVTMIVQGLGVGYLKNRYTDRILMQYGMISATAAYILLSQVTKIEEFCLALLPLIIGMTTIQAVLSAALTNAVPQQDTGSMIGLSMATNSLIRTAAPTIGGYLLEAWDFPSIGYLGAVVCGICTLILGR